MAQRFYFPLTGTAPASPAFGSLWDGTGAATRVPLVTAATNTTMTLAGVTETSTTNAVDHLVRQFVSDVLPAGAISGTFSMVVGGVEDVLGANAFGQVRISIVSGDGSVERGELYAGTTATVAVGTSGDVAQEFSNAGHPTRIWSAIALTSQTAQAGDRLCVELGVRFANTTGTSATGQLHIGDPTAGADQALTVGVGTNLRPWIEFSQNIFAAAIAVGQATETDTALAATSKVGVLVTAGQATEADTALTATARVGVTSPVGQAEETDTASAVAAIVGATVAVGQATETDTAAAASVVVAGGPVTITPDTADEADTALAVTALVGTVATVGQAEETDTALAVTPLVGATALVGLATETDDALVATLHVVATVGQATETDTAATASPLVGHTAAVGLATETDTAAAVTVIEGEVLDPPAGGDPTNRADGLDLTGIAESFWEPPVVPTPVGLGQGGKQDTAHILKNVERDGMAWSFDVLELSQPAHRERIVVGGRDVTYLRGGQTPDTPYQLMEPLTFGPATASFPQIAMCYGDRPGRGALKWLHDSAEVLIQRVNMATDEVVATDWRGVLTVWNPKGDGITIVADGDLSGRATMRNRQQPLWRARQDGGTLAYDAVAPLGLRFYPRLGPDTGIPLVAFGGMSWLDYLLQLCSRLQDETGTQWTIRYDRSNHVWRLVRKDRATVHATIYVDKTRAVADLRRALVEEPNTVYVTGTTPAGMVVRNAAIPGLRNGYDTPYPNADDRTIGPDDTNEDTDSGSGVTVMIWRLIVTGFLDREDSPGGYDGDVVRAVKSLQRKAGLTDNGVMGPATWLALFDLGVTGYTLMWSRILPMAQRSVVKEWFRTAAGNLIRRNPNYDAAELVRELNVNVGTGFNKFQMERWAEQALCDGPEWVGTVTLAEGVAVIAGEHNPGDPDPTVADILPGRALREGMNVWLPLHDGGTLFHVSTVDVNGGVTLDVDTRARDAMKVWEVIERNNESRTDPARATYLQSHRSSTILKDFGTWSEEGGLLDDTIDLVAGWNVFAVPAGESGTIKSIHVETSPNIEFAFALFGREISVERLEHLLPSPLTEAGSAKWDSNRIRRRLKNRYLLGGWGDWKQPCGYEYNRKTGDDGEPTLAILNGRFIDDAGLPFYTFRWPVIWCALWAPHASKVQPGRILKVNNEAGS